MKSKIHVNTERAVGLRWEQMTMQGLEAGSIRRQGSWGVY